MTEAISFGAGQGEQILAYIKDKYNAVQDSHCYKGDATVYVAVESFLDFVVQLKSDKALQLNTLIDLTAVDLQPTVPRFEVVYHLVNLHNNARLRIKLRVDEGQNVPSLFHEYLIANWMEREVWDMYGIGFDGHPDLRRILLYPEFEGHPLRKDYQKEHEQPRLTLVDHRPWRPTSSTESSENKQ